MKHFKTISEFHEFRGLPAPQHPLISVINLGNAKNLRDEGPTTITFDFYSIAVKRTSNLKVQYGQQPFDHNGGILSFMGPGKVATISRIDHEKNVKASGWMMQVHPDFLWNTPLAKTIRHYEFWGYSLSEALFLSEKEEAVITDLVQIIRQEYQSNIDKFSKKIIISHLEAFLNYAERFYHRQFITREKANHQVLGRLDELLTQYFEDENLADRGLPTVQYISEALNISPSYLRSLLNALTGKNTQQHIHEKVIEKAKEKLSTTSLSVSEIAYELGFEHPQSFSKLFKTKTNLSPIEFRASFN